MRKLTRENMSFSDQEFDEMWSLWRYKGHNPAEKLSVFETSNGDETYYSVGILDYISLENRIFPSEKVYKSYTQAFAAVGRALDKFSVCKDNPSDS
ncbi:hypothetical protein [Yersinia enterocolitica]|uniref:hypothetical protein n=1 Tax=Yersinia enterocolitica TaxID=630 RepID=UPI003D7AB303